MALSDLITIDATGFNYPDYPTILTDVTTEFKTIYGIDAYIDPDSMDGQALAIKATAIYDTLQYMKAGLSQFSPTFATGAWLSAAVKLNGIRRLAATRSTVDLTITGTNGTEILNGIAEDVNGIKWALPASVIIPASGSIIVTASSVDAGAFSASTGTITKISTPMLGWQTVTNASIAVIGRNTETDAELRRRQKVSTSIPSLSVFDGTIGAVANVAGVTRLRGYENDTNITDPNGILAHNIAVVVEGGDSQLIGNAIALHKTPGTPTFGTTSVTTYDRYNIPKIIKFYRPTVATIKIEVTLTAIGSYLASYADTIKSELVKYISALGIGDDIYTNKLYTPANLLLLPQGSTFNVTQIRIAKNAGAFGAANITLPFNEVALSVLADITVIVV